MTLENPLLKYKIDQETSVMFGVTSNEASVDRFAMDLSQSWKASAGLPDIDLPCPQMVNKDIANRSNLSLLYIYISTKVFGPAFVGPMLHQEPCSKHPALSGHIRELQSDYESDDLSGKNWRRDFPFASGAPTRNRTHSRASVGLR